MSFKHKRAWCGQRLAYAGAYFCCWPLLYAADACTFWSAVGVQAADILAGSTVYLESLHTAGLLLETGTHWACRTVPGLKESLRVFVATQ